MKNRFEGGLMIYLIIRNKEQVVRCMVRLCNTTRPQSSCVAAVMMHWTWLYWKLLILLFYFFWKQTCESSVHKCTTFSLFACLSAWRFACCRFVSEGSETKVEPRDEAADYSLRAEALTTGPTVWLHPSDASDSRYGSRPKATAHKGWYAPIFLHCCV